MTSDKDKFKDVANKLQKAKIERKFSQQYPQPDISPQVSKVMEAIEKRIKNNKANGDKPEKPTA